jgi:hypothetical protein
MEAAMGFLRVCLAVTTVALALAAVRRLLGGRSGCAMGLDENSRAAAGAMHRLVDQIVAGIKRQIQDRHLRPGAKLPSIRSFCGDLQRQHGDVAHRRHPPGYTLLSNSEWDLED